MSRIRNVCTLLLGTTALIGAPNAYTQTTDKAVDNENVIVVTGSQIKGAKIDDILPVTILTEEAIEATGAISGDELFRSIPQVGATQFNDQNTVGSANAARGDVASINLRDLGTGNTLLLINGRRMVLNPGFQTELLVPVVSPNTNTIPPGAVSRVEVLRDGASPIYGADAVAGVIDTQLKGNMNGGFLQGRYDFSDSTSQFEYNVFGGVGFDFNEGRSNLTVYGSYFHGNRVAATEQDFSSTDNFQRFFEGTSFEGDTQLDNRSTVTPWGRFKASSRITAVGDDDFHIQPATDAGCRINLPNGICIDDGSTTGNITSNLRYDSAPVSDLYSERDRYNAYALFNHEFGDGLEFYAEGSYYYSKLNRNIEQSSPLGAAPITISRTAYYNPFGAPDPTNPNRLVGVGAPATGATVQIVGYRAIDAGPRDIQVTGDSFRLLGGLRGELGEWDFDSAVLYTQANTTDRATRISNTLFQAAINRTDATAYNPFAGGSLTDPNSEPGTFNTGNSQATIDSFVVDVFRKGETTLALADFKISRNDVFELPAGDFGLALGVEARRETFLDDRDPRADGTITFTDTVSGLTDVSDILGTSPSPDTSGNREVYSAFAEVFVPLVSEDMEIPFVRKLDLQFAARFESFSDVGETLVPRVAASWGLNEAITLRGAWSKGFRAPNLAQVNDVGTTRSNTTDDFVRCLPRVERGEAGINNVDDCAGFSVSSLRSGTAELKPENTQSINLGIVISPPELRGFTFTVDYWRIKQTGLVGTFGFQNQVALDLLLRTQGSFNPNVLRGPVDADTIALFAGTSLAADPAGPITFILDPYLNLDSRTSKGIDFGMYYDIGETPIGDFNIRFNAARLRSFFQVPNTDGQSLLDANFPVEGLGELLLIDGRPKWRFSGSVNWSLGNFDVNLFGKYTGKFLDPSTTNVAGESLPVDSWFTTSISAGYTFKDKGPLHDTRIRIGANNVFDNDPPTADESYSYYGAEHSGKGRTLYFEVRKKF
ncbi:MAG: TonB-dependent receptor [Parasphingorhabdus sp.]|uniref:TonB-dependent receptor domain-containing protein n=1 Tax=Parasphingorhabdus sp. TaxID=2709688 RepID=UPI0030034ABA